MTDIIEEPSTILATERAAYDAMLGELLEHHSGKFVVIVGEELKDSFDSFNTAAEFANTEFGRGPYLIRQVGTPVTMTMPASVAYRPVNANP